MAVSLRHIFDVDAWSKAFSMAARHVDNPMAAHKIVGELVLGRVQQNFQDQGNPHERWPELSDATLLARARGRSGRGKVTYKRRRAGDGELAATPRAAARILSAKALIFTARLLRSETWQAAREYVDVGSNLIQAARLFFGSRAGVTPVTPARNPLVMAESDEREIESIYGKWLFGPLTGGSR